mmetsp:Transcript_13132/g.50229  ORF Transcript_13132/g.50229 Transcript_13132/m.50229 type:complete len:682 (-) Transcript_13132:654-2699(-)
MLQPRPRRGTPPHTGRETCTRGPIAAEGQEGQRGARPGAAEARSAASGHGLCGGGGGGGRDGAAALGSAGLCRACALLLCHVIHVAQEALHLGDGLFDVLLLQHQLEQRVLLAVRRAADRPLVLLPAEARVCAGGRPAGLLLRRRDAGSSHPVLERHGRRCQAGVPTGACARWGRRLCLCLRGAGHAWHGAAAHEEELVRRNHAAGVLAPPEVAVDVARAGLVAVLEVVVALDHVADGAAHARQVQDGDAGRGLEHVVDALVQGVGLVRHVGIVARQVRRRIRVEGVDCGASGSAEGAHLVDHGLGGALLETPLELLQAVLLEGLGLLAQLGRQALEHMDGAGVEVRDGRAVDDDGARHALGVLGRAGSKDEGPEECGVGEEDGRVEAEHVHISHGLGDPGEALDVAPRARAPGHAAEDGNVGKRGLLDDADQRDCRADSDAELDAKHDGCDERHNVHHEVALVHGPEHARSGELHQLDHGEDDHAAEGHVGEVLEEPGEEHHDNDENEGRDHPRKRGLGTSIGVDRGSAEAARGGEGVEEGADEVADAKAHQLLVGIDLVAKAERHGLGHTDGLHETDDAHDDGRSKETTSIAAEVFVEEIAGRGDTGVDLANDANSLLVQAGAGNDGDVDHHHDESVGERVDDLHRHLVGLDGRHSAQVRANVLEQVEERHVLNEEAEG